HNTDMIEEFEDDSSNSTLHIGAFMSHSSNNRGPNAAMIQHPALHRQSVVGQIDQQQQTIVPFNNSRDNMSTNTRIARSLPNRILSIAIIMMALIVFRPSSGMAGAWPTDPTVNLPVDPP